MKSQINNKGNNYCCGIKGKIILIENICYNAEFGGHVIIGKVLRKNIIVFFTLFISIFRYLLS